MLLHKCRRVRTFIDFSAMCSIISNARPSEQIVKMFECSKQNDSMFNWINSINDAKFLNHQQRKRIAKKKLKVINSAVWAQWPVRQLTHVPLIFVWCDYWWLMTTAIREQNEKLSNNRRNSLTSWVKKLWCVII